LTSVIFRAGSKRWIYASTTSWLFIRV